MKFTLTTASRGPRIEVFRIDRKELSGLPNDSIGVLEGYSRATITELTASELESTYRIAFVERFQRAPIVIITNCYTTEGRAPRATLISSASSHVDLHLDFTANNEGSQSLIFHVTVIGYDTPDVL